MNKPLKMRDLVAALVGFVCGAVLMIHSVSPNGGLKTWRELFRRIAWSFHGGGGESANWGEPLFYMSLIGIPSGFVGAVLFLAASWIFRKQ